MANHRGKGVVNQPVPSPPTGLWRLLWKCCLYYAAVCLLVFLAQRRLLYFPSHHPGQGPLDPWRHEGELLGCCREVRDPRTVWFMLHGNAGQAADRSYLLNHIPSSDALYILEYPGYGSRPGTPTLKSINAAASSAYRSLLKRHPKTPVCVLGESLGSGPACVLAKEPVPPPQIVLITPFDDLARVASQRFSFLPVRWLLKDRWDNGAALSGYLGRLTVYGAARDSVIPIQHAKKLAEGIPQATFVEIPGGHNDWAGNDAVKIFRE